MTPSYTFNILTITGKRHELEAFREFAGGFDPNLPLEIRKGNALCFEKFIPLPSKSNRTMLALEDARIRTWGCGSNAVGTKVKETDHKLRYSFITFGSIPKPVLEFMVANFPSLNFALEFRNDRKGINGAMHVHKGIPHFAQTDKFYKEKVS